MGLRLTFFGFIAISMGVYSYGRSAEIWNSPSSDSSRVPEDIQKNKNVEKRPPEVEIRIPANTVVHVHFSSGDNCENLFAVSDAGKKVAVFNSLDVHHKTDFDIPAGAERNLKIRHDYKDSYGVSATFPFQAGRVKRLSVKDHEITVGGDDIQFKDFSGPLTHRTTNWIWDNNFTDIVARFSWNGPAAPIQPEEVKVNGQSTPQKQNSPAPPKNDPGVADKRFTLEATVDVYLVVYLQGPNGRTGDPIFNGWLKKDQKKSDLKCSKYGISYDYSLDGPRNMNPAHISVSFPDREDHVIVP